MAVPDRRRVAVVGAGTMGHGIALVAALSGHDVALVDTAEERIAAALASVRATLDEGVARGELGPTEPAAALGRIRAGTDLPQAVAEAELVVEAVPERLSLKREVFGTLEAHAPARCILASNTSSLSITALQEDRERPGRVLGLHFFNPVHRMGLVEVVEGRRTEAAVVDAAIAFAHGLGKEPIVVRDAPGFATSRLGVALGLEAMRLLEDGVASAADIDRAMELGYGHPMGPLRLSDLVGLDVRLAIAEHLHRTLGERFRPPEILRRLVAEGKLGRKTGVGFHRWH